MKHFLDLTLISADELRDILTRARWRLKKTVRGISARRCSRAKSSR